MIAANGYLISKIELPPAIRGMVVQRNWEALDRAIAAETAPTGMIFKELRNHGEFSEIEFIIAIRSSREEPDEDGIWHDDGSRVLAFSLSLTLNPEAIEGGRLEIKKRGADLSTAQILPTPPFGTMIVFATGHQGFEHKIGRVIQGERIIIAGWCR